jgi:hypothetical protein
MKKWLGGAALTIVLAAPAPAAAGELRLSIANGRVTLVAQDVTIKQILDEWSRVGQTTIVGAERIVGGPVTMELTDVAEGRALEALLRSASGYIAKPRVGAPGASGYDRILIMPVSRPPAVSAAPAPFNRTQPPIQMPNIVDDDDEPNPNPIMPPGAAMPPGVPQPPQQFPGQPPMPAQPGMANPQSPTLSRPGQLPPPTGFPGNPYQPAQPPPPVRPPGGGPGGMVPGPGGGGQ